MAEGSGLERDDETYDDARRKLRRAQEGSDLESEMDLGRGKRKKKCRDDSPDFVVKPPLPPHFIVKKTSGKSGRQRADMGDCVSESEESEPMCHSEPPTTLRKHVQEKKGLHQCKEFSQPRKHGNVYTWNDGASTSTAHVDKAQHHSSLKAYQDPLHHSASIRSKDQGQPNRSRSPSFRSRDQGQQNRSQGPSYVADFNKQVIRLLQTILIRIDHQSTVLDTISARLCSGIVEIQEELLKEQFSNVKEFEKFNENLSKSTQLRSTLIKELSSLGGYNASSATRRFLEAIMTQEVAVHYSWLGRKGKRAFSTLPICDIMY
ncbi:hypothetical protein MTO96_044634, partial [Rhipicephalus appendiculatus]